jgi:hypothetical protein
MALELKNTLGEVAGCRVDDVVDSTGTYDATTNPTGWGDASTALINDILSAKIVLYFDDATIPYIYLLQITNGVITSVTLTLPDLSVNPIVITNTVFPFTTVAPFEITGSHLLADVATLDDNDQEINFGRYTLEYYVYDDIAYTSEIGSVSSDNLVVCQVERAVKNAQGALDVTGCECDDTDALNAFLARVLLDSAKYASTNGEPDKASTTLDYAYNKAIGECKTC